jgi:hypothetical protein
LVFAFEFTLASASSEIYDVIRTPSSRVWDVFDDVSVGWRAFERASRVRAHGGDAPRGCAGVVNGNITSVGVRLHRRHRHRRRRVRSIIERRATLSFYFERGVYARATGIHG